MNRVRATFRFIFSGGLLVFLAPYLIREAVLKRIPWLLAVIAIPFYALLSYSAFKMIWPRITGTAGTTAQNKDEPNRPSPSVRR